LAGLLVVLLAAGCSVGHLAHGLRNHLSRFTSDYCAAALPVAMTAVHDKGKLIYLHAARRGTFGSHDCVVVFKGSFGPTSVTGAPGESGTYAVIIVRQKDPTVLRASVRTTFNHHILPSPSPS
jgi:hypothetical protein